MWALDDEDGSVWLGGLVIDAAAQGVGVGRATVMAFLRRFSQDGSVNVALSYSPDNTIARKLYADIGFVETGEMEDDEIVARFQRDDVPVP
jgi:diamine N-acetyltransferase